MIKEEALKSFIELRELNGELILLISLKMLIIYCFLSLKP